jgi:hypothetical protein
MVHALQTARIEDAVGARGQGAVTVEHQFEGFVEA